MRGKNNETQPSTIAEEMIDNTTRHMPTDDSTDYPASNARSGGMENTNFESAETNERIGQRAYEIYLQRGGADSGSDHSLMDWLQAEAEIRGRSTTENSGQPLIDEDIDERYSTASSNA